MAKQALVRVIWITGGASGIGKACAMELLRAGCLVAISGRSSAALDHVEGDVFRIGCDVTNEEAVATSVAAIEAKLGPIDVLINCAGVFPGDTFTETSLATFNRTIETNLIGTFIACRAVLPSMYARKSGVIINMLSVASEKAFVNGAAYIASKHAALGFTRALRDEARKFGVKVIAILPGATETPAWSEQMREENRDRMMQPEDIATIVRQLLEQPDRMLTEEITIRPIGGDL